VNEPIVLDVDISEQYDMTVGGNDGYDVSTDSKIVINKIEADPYEGEYVITPSGAVQILATKDKKAAQNITIQPIPQNYGLITWNGSFLTVS
jgi:hypothetical protein